MKDSVEGKKRSIINLHYELEVEEVLAESEELYEPHSLCCQFNPLLPHLFLVGEDLSEQLQKELLSLLVVVWRTGGQLLHGDRHTEGPFYPE